MGQKVATLEIELAMATGGAVSDVARFGGVVDKVSAQAINDLNKIDAAMKGVGGLDGPTQAAVRLADQAAKSAVAVAREAAQIERSGEAMVRSLERQNAAYGKTREEVRGIKAEEAALAAERVGNADLANRIRAEEMALFEQEAIAYRKSSQAAAAAAEDKAAAAAQALVAAEREATAIREAAQAHQLFEAAARRGSAAWRDAQAVEAAAAREAENMAAAGERLRASIDPAYAAQQRFNREIGEARTLVGAGAVSLDDYCAKLRVEQSILEKSTEVHRGLGTAQRFTASETLNLSRQFQDIGVTAAMGMNPLMILVQQGPQIYDVLEQAKARGVGAATALKQMGMDAVSYGATGLSKLATFITPVNALLAGTAIATVAAVKALTTYGTAMDRFEATASGLGRVSGETAQQLEAISEAAAASGQRSIGATRDSVAAFAAAGIQGEQTLTSLAANVERYGKLTGQDVPAAQAALAEAMKDPARAADTFTQQLGLLTGAQYEHIRQLAAQGDQDQATAELTRILTRDLAANANQTTGLAHYMDMLGGAVSGVATWFGKLDGKIRAAGASYDAWLKQHVGGWAVDLIGTGNQMAPGVNPNAARNQDQIAALNASQSMNTSGMKQYNDLLAQQRVLQKGLADTTGLTAVQIQGLRHDYSAVTDTINANRNASGAWITTQDRAHLIAVAQDKLAAAHTQREKAAAQQQISRLQLGTQVLTQQERQTQAQDAYNKVADKYVKPKTDHHADELAREAEATEAQIKNLYKLADAYGVSGGAALIAEARTKAESAAIKSKADIDAVVARQIRLTIAQRVSDASKSTDTMNDQAAAQEKINGMVAAGLVPADRAAQLVQAQIADLPLLGALQAAQQIKDAKGIAEVTKRLEEQRAARERLQTDARTADFNAAIAAGANRLAELKEELRLVGATDAARVHALATLKATQEAEKYNAGDREKYVRQQVEIADTAQELAEKQARFNAELRLTTDLANSLGDSLSDAFGRTGNAIGGMIKILGEYGARQEAISKAVANHAITEQDGAKRSADLQISSLIGITSAAKGLFKEHSAGYRAMEAAEKALTIVQLARTAIDVAGGAAKMFSSLGPFAFPAVAAMLGVMASLGFSGGGGGVSSADYAKGNDGTGTVLGDSTAKSDSIQRSIDALKEVDTLTNTFAREMASSLKSIDSQIGNLATVLVRSNNLDASDGVTEGFKTSGTGKLLGSTLIDPTGLFSKIPVLGDIIGGISGVIKSLFGTKTKVIGSGITAGDQTISDILSSGLDAQTYSDIQKKKKFFGVTTSTKYKTQLGGAVDDDVSQQFALILKSFNDSIVAAAGPLGQSTDAISDKLGSFVFSLGKIDLKGLTGEEISDKLSAVFGAAADDMAKTAFPLISQFAKVGEGAFETLVRVASTVEQVTNSIDQLGLSSANLDIAAKMAIADQFDSVSAMVDATDSYFSAFYTKAEQAAARTAQLTRVFDHLGLALPDTLAGFRSLVEAQDLTTAAGQSTYATLLQLAPAFADLKTSMDGAKSAVDILSERQDLQRQLLEATGDTAAIRALDLAKLDASNRGLQEQIYAVQDAKAAADAAEQLASAWKSVGDSITDEINRIRGLSDASGGASFASLMGQFNAANTAARAGDMDAAKSLPQLSKSLLDAAALAATSRQELDRVQAQTAAMLEATYGSISTLADSGTGSADLPTVQTTTSGTDGNDSVAELRKEVASMRTDLVAALAQIAGNTGRSTKILENVTSASGGDAVNIANAA